jgi:gliding motility-associated-like protein
MKDYDVTDISGTPSGQMLNYRASDDGDWLFVQAGGGPDVSGPTLSIITFDNTLVSDGASSQTFINFDFLQDICEGATITEARLKLFADTNTPGHSASAVDNNCILLQRGFSAWDEGSMSTTLPFVSGINVSFLDSPTSPYQNYDLDVTILTNDIVANGGFGFAMIPQCSDKNIELHFASKDHPNPALHPQLVLTIDDSNCSEPSLLGECCHEIDITNDCPTDFFTSLELKSITPGVNIGSHATGGSMPQDWSVSNSTPNCVAWTHNSGYIPPGTTADLIQFCLDDIDPGETPQDVVLNWYALDGNGEPYIACSDTIRFECEPPIDNPCITVIDTDIKSSPCDSLDCYETPWCVQWLRDTIGAQVGLPEILSYNSVEKGIWNGQVVFVATNPTPPGAANIGNTDIYLCNGTLIQKCEITLFGEVCNPTQSINPSTDITGKMLIWQTGDTVPPLDPDCASGSGSQNTVDVCLTFKNSSQHFADQFIIYPITSGVSYWPNPISLLPTGSIPCDTSTVTFQLFGSAITPGTTVKFGVRLADTQNPDSWCCFESDTVCVVIPECPMTDDCCASQDTFDMLVNQGFQVTQDDCSITVCANQFDTCHYFSNLSPDWGDGSIILPTVLQSHPPNNCWSYTYTTPGSYVITLPVWEGDIDDACWSDVLSYTFECDTLQPAVCAACPDGQVQGPNLLVNGDFEAGNTGFTNGYTYQSSGALGVGDYSVRTSTTLANAAWAATDYTTGTGQFLTVDGIPGVPFWQNTVTTIPGQDYSLCLFYDHLVAPRLLDFGNASIEVIIDGSTVATVLVNQLPDAWQNITVNYTAISASTNLQLQLAAGSAGFQDVAIDNISFTACGVVVTDPCCDVTEEDFCDEFDVGINYSLNGCELCLPFVLDSCEYLNINYGDGTVVSLNGGGVAPCYTYPGPSGSYTVSVDYFRLDSNQDTCLRKTAVLDIITACPPSASSCLSVIDGNLDCDQGAYCFRITTDTMRSLAFIELTASIALSPDPYRLQAPLAPGVSSEEICLTYIGAFQGDTVCFDVVGHREDITIGEDPIFCCQDTTPVCFVVDCPVVSSTCISVVEDSIDCATQTYCIRVANNTFFDINSIAFHRFSAGHSLSPDPLGIPTLIPGDTSSWICLTYLGASAGDSVCYNIVGHEQDLSSGQEPIFCCSDETTYCFEVACDTDPCCDVSSGYLDSLITTGSDIIIDQCEVTLPFLPDTCATLSIDFGDGDMWQSTGTDTVRHTYMNDGIYDLDITIQYFNDEGAICAEVSDNLEIEIQDCGMGRLCQLDDLTIYNALTPNDDGYNDVLVIDGNSTCQLDILIYNRWGQLVYRGDDYQNDWKGTSLSGDNLAEGTYFLIVNLTDGSGESVDSRQTYIDIRK